MGEERGIRRKLLVQGGLKGLARIQFEVRRGSEIPAEQSEQHFAQRTWKAPTASDRVPFGWSLALAASQKVHAV